MSPIANVPAGFATPMTSPGYASSTVERVLAIMVCTCERVSSFPLSRACFTFMPRSKRPEQTRTYASRSRCFGSRLACSLKTKPEKSGVVGSMVSCSSAISPEVKSRPSAPFSSTERATGDEPSRMKASRKRPTPGEG